MGMGWEGVKGCSPAADLFINHFVMALLSKLKQNTALTHHTMNTDYKQQQAGHVELEVGGVSCVETVI